ncbi:YfbM family protein [Actinoplanes sp. G11-F43]|uniref:YfbM family protein n=1 Tax=Actinoplanes sp. G11-F43 TaxID=3424130 RepID=UPI003D355E92
MGISMIGSRLPVDQWQAVIEDPGRAWRVLDDPGIHLQKSWQGLHYLLTGTRGRVSAGVGSAILGGTEIGEDPGYGPPRLLTPDEVAAVASALDATDPPTLRARYDPEVLEEADVYPGAWPDKGFDDFLGPYYDALRDFYRSAAAGGQAVIMALT